MIKTCHDSWKYSQNLTEEMILFQMNFVKSRIWKVAVMAYSPILVVIT